MIQNKKRLIINTNAKKNIKSLKPNCNKIKGLEMFNNKSVNSIIQEYSLPNY